MNLRNHITGWKGFAWYLGSWMAAKRLIKLAVTPLSSFIENRGLSSLVHIQRKCLTQVWHFHRPCLCSSVREASSLSDGKIFSIHVFLDLADLWSPLAWLHLEGDSSSHKDLELKRILIVKVRVEMNKPCLAGLPEVIIQIFVLVPYYIRKSHRGTNPSVWLVSGISKL